MVELDGREAARPEAGMILIWPLGGRVKEGVDRPGALEVYPWGVTCISAEIPGTCKSAGFSPSGLLRDFT